MSTSHLHVSRIKIIYRKHVAVQCMIFRKTKKKITYKSLYFASFVCCKIVFFSTAVSLYGSACQWEVLALYWFCFTIHNNIYSLPSKRVGDWSVGTVWTAIFQHSVILTHSNLYGDVSWEKGWANVWSTIDKHTYLTLIQSFEEHCRMIIIISIS